MKNFKLVCLDDVNCEKFDAVYPGDHISDAAGEEWTLKSMRVSEGSERASLITLERDVFVRIGIGKAGVFP